MTEILKLRQSSKYVNSTLVGTLEEFKQYFKDNYFGKNLNHDKINNCKSLFEILNLYNDTVPSVSLSMFRDCGGSKFTIPKRSKSTKEVELKTILKVSKN